MSEQERLDYLDRVLNGSGEPWGGLESGMLKRAQEVIATLRAALAERTRERDEAHAAIEADALTCARKLVGIYGNDRGDSMDAARRLIERLGTKG